LFVSFSQHQKMGKILGALGSGKQPEDMFIDFENAKPSEEEQELYDEINKVLVNGPAIVDRLRQYSGCEDWIRKAITNPTAESEELAWNAILPAVDQLLEFYQFSLALEGCFPNLLVALCKNDPKDSLANQQALAKQLADVFDFVLKFDDQKMSNPAIQNDFSYYRRTLNRMKLSKKEANIKIRDELANRMSLFYAYPTPMMKLLTEVTTKSLLSDAPGPKILRSNVTTALATMSNVCHSMVDNKKFSSDETNMFCLRAMTGGIILFDHLDEPGAFSKKSPINIKACVTTLKQYLKEHHNIQSEHNNLLNAVRFTTLHLNDSETPSTIKNILNAN